MNKETKVLPITLSKNTLLSCTLTQSIQTSLLYIFFHSRPPCCHGRRSCVTKRSPEGQDRLWRSPGRRGCHTSHWREGSWKHENCNYLCCHMRSIVFHGHDQYAICMIIAMIKWEFTLTCMNWKGTIQPCISSDLFLNFNLTMHMIYWPLLCHTADDIDHMQWSFHFDIFHDP